MPAYMARAAVVFGWPGVSEGGVSRAGTGMRWAPRLIEGESYNITPRDEASAFQPGDRIFHQKFGYGTIEEIEGSKLEIAFEKAGRKKVLDSFVQSA